MKLLSAETLLALRYLRPRRTFVSVITILSVLGVTLGVAVLIVVLSVMAGFEQELRNKVIGFHAHLTLVGHGSITRPEEVIASIRQEPETVAATPYVQGPVLVEFKHRISTPVLRGIDADSSEAVIPMIKNLVAGDKELIGESVLVGADWAARMGASVGDKVLVYSPRSLDEKFINPQATKKDKIPTQQAILPTELLITGVFKTGLFDYDMNFMITSIENAQRFYRMEGQAHGIAVRLKDPLRAADVQQRWNDSQRSTAFAKTWMDQNRPLFNAIAMERVVMTFLLFFIVIVAAFGLCSTLITITVQKRSEIGLLKALGAQDYQVMSVFMLHGLWVGSIGAITGWIFGHLALAYRNDFRLFLHKAFGIDAFIVDIYQFAEIPAVHNPVLGVWIGIAAIFICILAAAIPAYQAARIDPARALRRE